MWAQHAYVRSMQAYALLYVAARVIERMVERKCMAKVEGMVERKCMAECMPGAWLDKCKSMLERCAWLRAWLSACMPDWCMARQVHG